MAVAKKITINDVALAAGVSVSTVSLVLSGKGRISPATGQRVNEAVEQLGFVRNRQASALRGGQSGVIGLIVRDLTSPFYAELTAGLTEALEAQGRMVFLLHGGREADQLLSRLDMLLNQGVDGVIVAGRRAWAASCASAPPKKACRWCLLPAPATSTRPIRCARITCRPRKC
jgi:LacI family transcriptional regulator of maltose regulon